MKKLRNRTDQPLVIDRGKASPLHVLAERAVVVEDHEAQSEHVKALVAAGILEIWPIGAKAAPPRGAPPLVGRREGEPVGAPPPETQPDTVRPTAQPDEDRPASEPAGEGRREGEPARRGKAPTSKKTEG